MQPKSFQSQIPRLKPTDRACLLEQNFDCLEKRSETILLAYDICLQLYFRANEFCCYDSDVLLPCRRLIFRLFL